MRRLILTAVVYSFMICPATMMGEVRARQGESKEKVQFQSPMILELPLPPVLAPEQRGKKEILTDENLHKYVCDGVFIARFAASSLKRGGNALPVQLSLYIANGPGHDAVVNVTGELFVGDTVVAGPVTVTDIEVEEEGMASNVLVTLNLPYDHLEPVPMVRLTIAVRKQ